MIGAASFIIKLLRMVDAWRRMAIIPTRPPRQGGESKIPHCLDF